METETIEEPQTFHDKLHFILKEKGFTEAENFALAEI